jgi:hypothetical protein
VLRGPRETLVLQGHQDWPNKAVPKVAAGAYSIWMGEQLVYVGMSGRSATEEKLVAARAKKKASGLRTRLASHWKGRRSGDQFVRLSR